MDIITILSSRVLILLLKLYNPVLRNRQVLKIRQRKVLVAFSLSWKMNLMQELETLIVILSFVTDDVVG